MHDSVKPPETGLMEEIRFPGLSALPGLYHAVFSRSGGVSAPPFDSLNASFGVGDAPENVQENRKRIAHRSGATRLLLARQVHGIRTLVLTENEAPVESDNPPEADAILTNVPGYFPLVQVADCQPVLLADPRNRAVAAVHSGWRGSVQNVVGTAVSAMREHFGTDPADLRAGVGPSLGPCCGEFVNYETEIPEPLWKYRISEHHFDFWALTRDQFLETGVPETNIHVSGICTKCNTGRFFSYRGEKTTGRFAAVIGYPA